MRAVMTILMCAFAAMQPQAAAAQAIPAGNPISQALKDAWDGAKRNIVESADQMPEANYAFKPADTVRTFGQILAHVAGANYLLCAEARAEKSPFTEDHFEQVATTRADIVKALGESMAYCDAAYAGLTDAKAAEIIPAPFGNGKRARASALVRNTAHLQEHYGNLVTYFRIKGLTPPSSRR